jgi:prefoldin beta subunit
MVFSAIYMSGVSQLPPQVQERIQRLQQLQNTMQQLLAQRQRIEMEVAESDKALEVLKEVPGEAKVYKSVGAVLVEKERDKVVKELEERKEFLDMRAKVLQKQEDKTKEKLTGLQETLQKELGINPAA